MLSEEEVIRRRAELEERRQQKKAYQRRQRWIYALVIVMGFVLMFITARYTYLRGVEDKALAELHGDRLLILFLGTDELIEENVRADSIMVFSLDPKTGTAGVLSIPRDTRVWVPTRQKWERINSTYAHGGAKMAMEAVSGLLGVPIAYYVQTDFGGFKQMVDLLGGVEIDVKKEMRYVDQSQDLVINISPGRQVLNGDKALQYVRFRDTLGDVSLVDPFADEYDGRVERQRKFFEALISKGLSPSSIPKLPRLAVQVFRIVDTNLPVEKLIDLALSASKFSTDQIETAVLPGNSKVIEGAWYWLVNESKSQAVIDLVVWGKPEPLKFIVLNGNGRPGESGRVADHLGGFGFNVVSYGNAGHFNYENSQIVVAKKHRKRIEPLADYLKASIQEVDADTVEVQIILGRDFNLDDRSVGI